MSFKWINKIKLLLVPPKKGEIYYGNPLHFVIGRGFEQVLHSLKDRNGVSVLTPVPSNDCYRLRIQLDAVTYYVCEAEVFCKATNDLYVTNTLSGQWMHRSQPRRVKKELFNQWILDGVIEKEKI